MSEKTGLMTLDEVGSMRSLTYAAERALAALTSENGPVQYGHYGHNSGSTPVCGDGIYGEERQRHKGFLIFPHGDGIGPGRAWCPDCQRILQSIHGAHSFQNPREATREEAEESAAIRRAFVEKIRLTFADLNPLVEAAQAWQFKKRDP